MKRIAAALAIIFAIGFSSCQCSYKPPVPPVEDDKVAVVVPDAPVAPNGIRA
ncbi:hypothetical protein [Longibacter salinarum]|uniref:hypothetical protein n=1 Tax=Longibacter salinarum TaxID=1850348 RepID=UPI0015CF341B|nr:hypothetical protein [Longibacter salinarum]